MKIKRILRLWGRWATPRLGLEYPAISIAFRAAHYQAEYSVLHLTDESAMLIDKVVLSLQEVNYQWFEIILGQYIYQANEKELLAYFGMSRSSFYNELAKAESYILGGVKNSDVKVVFFA